MQLAYRGWQLVLCLSRILQLSREVRDVRLQYQGALSVAAQEREREQASWLRCE